MISAGVALPLRVVDDLNPRSQALSDVCAKAGDVDRGKIEISYVDAPRHHRHRAHLIVPLVEHLGETVPAPAIECPDLLTVEREDIVAGCRRHQIDEWQRVPLRPAAPIDATSASG